MSAPSKRNSRAMKAADGATAARVRARDVDAIVVEIARVMVDGTWSREAALGIAAREQVKLGTVDEWASDAGRLLRVGHDVETYRAVNLARLDETYAAARGSDAKAAVAAVAEQNRMLGLHAPQQIDVNVQMYAQLSPEKMLERALAQRAELDELIPKLQAKVAVTVPALPAKEDDDDNE